VIEFASEDTRTHFHSLPTDLQLTFDHFSIGLGSLGYVLNVITVPTEDDPDSDIVIRIDKQFEVSH